MKMYRCLLALFAVFSTTPNFAQEKRVIATIPSTIAFSVDEKDLFPESISYDSKTKQFFLSSIHKNKIIAVDSLGKCVDFIKSDQDGMLRSLGLKVDVRMRRLWVVSNSDWSDTMVSAVHVYDIDSKELLKSFFTPKNNIPTFNDLVIKESGDALISDYGGNSIYQVTSDLNKLELYLKSDSLLVGANGMAISADGSFLYVASNTKGIVLVDLKSKSIQAIKNQISSNTQGIDGLMLYKNSLIGIFNGDRDLSKHNISRYQLNDNGNEIVSASILDQNNPLFNEPTSGVIVGDDLYCLAATYLRQFVMDGNMDFDKLKNPIVLKYNLE